VYGWQPQPFSNESLSDPDNELAQAAKTSLGRDPDSDHIAVTCEGEACRILSLLNSYVASQYYVGNGMDVCKGGMVEVGTG